MDVTTVYEYQLYYRGIPGEPAKIKCKLNGENQVRMGETLKGDIVVMVMDTHGNDIKKVLLVQHVSGTLHCNLRIL